MLLKDKLQNLKSNKKVTIKDMSKGSNIPIGTVNKLLNGEANNPTMGNIQKLSDYFECTMDYLMGKSVTKTIVEPSIKLNIEEKRLIDIIRKLPDWKRQKIISIASKI